MNLPLPTPAECHALFLQKYGDPQTTGWGPRLRWKHEYYTPADIYEALVSRMVFEGCRWIDVGGGGDIFPDNAPLARTLVSRAGYVVGVDPSDNIQQNAFVHERAQSLLEEFNSPAPFDLATLRMVVEHVEHPAAFVEKLRSLLKPGGQVVILTVNRWAPISLVARLTPFRLHHPIKALFWGGEEKDTFPVRYRMNSRDALHRIFTAHQFDEVLFRHLDDLSTTSGFRRLNGLELRLWDLWRRVAGTYPENCLLAVYRRR